MFQRTASGEVYYYQNDHLGTPQRLIAANGATVWEARYSAFGEAEIIVNTVENNLRFPGQYYDQATGLHQNYFRDYDPSVGRYIQSDPIGLAGGINAYGYVGGNPIGYVDPLGLVYGLGNGSSRYAQAVMVSKINGPAEKLTPQVAKRKLDALNEYALNSATAATLLCQPEIAAPLGMIAFAAEGASFGLDMYINRDVNGASAAGLFSSGSIMFVSEVISHRVPPVLKNTWNLGVDLAGQASDFMYDTAASNKDKARGRNQE